MKKWKTKLQEAVASNKIQIAILKVCNIVSKRIGHKLSVSLLPMDVLKADGQRLTGIIAVFGNRQIRFNWRTTDKSSQIISIDYWTKVKKNPDYTLEVGDYNLIQIISAITQFIKNPTVGEILTEDAAMPKAEVKFRPEIKESIYAFFKDMELNEQDIANRRISELYNQYLFWFRESGMNTGQYVEVSSATFRNFCIYYLDKAGLKNIFMRSVTTKVAGKEKIIVTDKVEAKKWDEETYRLTLNDKMDMVKQGVRMVVQGLQNCLILGGTAGVGKTTLVNEVLDNISGKKIVKLKGGISKPIDYYKFLYNNNGENIIIFADDTDEIISKREFVNLSKAAMDSQKHRIISFYSKEINDDEIKSNVKQDDVLARYNRTQEPQGKKTKSYPTSFEFKSRFVIVTNLEKKKVDSAILSRGVYLETNFSPADIIDSLRVNVSQLFPELDSILDDKMKLDIINFIEEFALSVSHIDYRIFKTIATYRAAVPFSPVWKKFAMMAVSSL